MEILVELFLYFMIDGTEVYSHAKKTPKSMRVLALSFIIVFMFMMFYLAYYSRSNTIGMYAFILIGSVTALFLSNLLSEYKKMKSPGNQ